MSRQASGDYIIATRGERHWSPVDGAAMTILAARAEYDQGRIELAQGRVGGVMELFAIPRRNQIKRRPYFSYWRARA